MIRSLVIFCMALIITACGDSDNAIPPAELVDFEPSIKVRELWSVDTGDGVGQQYLKLYPLLREDSLVVSDRNGQVTAYALESGKELWSKEFDTQLSGGVGGNDKYLVLTGKNGHVILLDKNGKLLWQVDTSSEVLMPAVIAANLVIIRSVDGRVSALDLDNGDTKWTYKRDVPALSLRGNSAPVIKQGYIFIGLDNGRLVVLDLIDGHTVFDIPVGSASGRSELERMIDIDGNLVIKDDILYLSSYQGKVVAIDIRRGQLSWNRNLSSYNGVELTPSGLFLSDDQDHVWALDVNNGATLWKLNKLQARQITRPVSHKRDIVVADYEGYLHWMSSFNGEFLARVETDGSGIITPPLTKDGVLYVITRDGNLYAYTTDNNE